MTSIFTIKKLPVAVSLAEHFQALTLIPVSPFMIRSAIFDSLAERTELDLVTIFDIDTLELDFETMAKLLSEFDFSVFALSVDIEETNFPSGLFPDRYASVKVNGMVWRVHLNDRDPFPSRPHAHNYEIGIKLDLSNGNCFKRRRLVNRLRKADLEAIRSKLLQVYHGELPAITV